MIDGKFNVVFRGQIVKSQDLTQVKQNLAKLFKSNEQAIERLFGGQEVVIRKDLDYAGAMKYQSALKNAGALALIQEVESQEVESAATERQAAPQTQTNAPSSDAPAATAPSTANVAVSTAENSSEAGSSEAENSDNLTVAEVGAQILPPKVYEKRDVDTSELSLAAAGERILPEKEPEEHPQPSIDHLKLTD
ncbi:MAG: hypothetical protein OQJ89_05880 [Kangiellaceae bacterium]|nr:hypothetical protein [Kangiellaceae bacterium]MCW9016471.1 hypothetical protein [Kangiellaceae bacterium]